MLSSWKIGSRLAAGFGVVLLGLVAIGGLAVANIRQAQELTHSGAQRHQRTAAVASVQKSVWALRTDVARFAAAADAAERNEIAGRSAIMLTDFEEAMARAEAIRSTEAGSDEARVTDELKAAFAAYYAARQKWFELLSNWQVEEAARFHAGELAPAGERTIAAMGALIDLQQRLMEQEESAAMAQLERSLVGVVAVGSLSLLFAALVVWLLARSITRPLGEAVAAVRAVAQGDLSRPIRVRSRDEVGDLLASLQQMQQALQALVGEVATGARMVSESTRRIAQGHEDLSQRTASQAGTLEETASAMEELTSTVAQNAENAGQATQLASGASGIARQGGQVVGEVVSTMNGIAESSRKVADIVGVIDGIAFQTNILALNAAVEAARAGEQGRGFAVVAGEVRALAQRSAGAAREIKALIGASVQQVEDGTRQVGGAGRTMNDIVSAVHKVNELIAEIAAASREQHAGIEQVNTAVTQMDQVVQQNASLVDDVKNATDAMQAQAAALLGSIARFKLAGEQAAPVVTAAAAAAPAAVTADPPQPQPQPIRVSPPPPRLAPVQPPLPRRVAAAGEGGWQEF